MAKQPISNYIYYTKEEALAASAILGCSGYRTYLVDGVRVYLPCDEVDTFEKLTSYTIVKGLIVSNGNETFGGNLVGLQFTTNDVVKGDAFFTLGNFSINTTVVLGEKEQPFVNPNSDKKQITATTLTSTSGDAAIEKLNKIAEDKKVTFNFSKINLERYVLFGSLSDKLKFALIDISVKFPASLKFKPGGVLQPTIIKHTTNSSVGTTSFELNISNIFNPYDILYDFDSKSIDDTTLNNPLRNLSKYYRKYEIVYNGVRYPILNLSPTTSNKPNISLTILGMPFISNVTSKNTLNTELFITPSKDEYLLAFNGMSDMSRYLLNQPDPLVRQYVANFSTPIFNDNGETTYEVKTLTFPMYDEYNIDVFSSKFQQYIDKLSEIGKDFDAAKTNLVSRFLTTESLKEFDTDEQKVNILLKSFGMTFDSVKQYIDALAFMTNVDYNKIENIPDLLLKNFARTLGWKTYEIEDEETIVQSLFDLSEDPDTEGDITPAALDIELWRRLLTNSAYLFKSKGTRKSIDAILKIVGIPELIYEINEYVYLAQNKLDYNQYKRKLFDLSSYPIDSDGYPTTPTRPYFQKGGGNVLNDSANLGPYDDGREYINQFKKFDSMYAFDVYKVLDNKKSWVITTSQETRVDDNVLNDTSYEINDSRLLINAKNLDVYLSSDRIIDSRIYKFLNEYSYVLDSDFDSVFSNTVDPSTLSFNGFMRESLDKFINVTNRKTIVTYPTLTKIYYDYMKKSEELGLNYVDYGIALAFLQKYDTYWVELVKQFIPATTILSSGKKIANSKFNDNKFKYHHGQTVKPVTGEIDTDVNWLGTDGSEFQSFALRPVIDGRVEMTKNTASIVNAIKASTDVYNLSGTPKNSTLGYLNRSGYYSGYHYGLFESNNGDIADITDQLYLDNQINFFSPPPLPHVCFYGNSTQILPSSVFETNLGTNSTVTAFDAKMFTNLPTTFNISDGYLIIPTINDTAEINGNFVINDVLTTTGNETFATFVEFDYENMLLHVFNNKTTLVDNTINPVLSLVFVDGSNNEVSDTISIELKPTLYNSILTKNKVRFNTLIKTTTTVGKIGLKGVFKIEKIKEADNITRDLTYYNDAIMSGVIADYLPYGLGPIKILGISVSTTPLYSEILSTSTDAYLDEWFSEKYFIQQPKYYGLLVLDDTDTELSAIINTNNGRLQTKDGWIGEYLQGREEYELLSEKTTIDPLMHVPTIYENSLLVTDENDTLTFNLSQSLQLTHTFSPTYTDDKTGIVYGGVYNNNESDNLAVVGNNQVIEENIYMSDSVSIFFDGMYATPGTITGGGPGPIYRVKTKPDITSHISSDTLCVKGADTYIKLVQPGNNFQNSSDLVSVNGTTTTYYQALTKQLFKIKGELIFDSDYYGKQNVIVKLIDGDGKTIAEQSGIFASSKNNNYISIESRTVSFDFNIFLNPTIKLYLVVKAVDYDCYVKEYDEVDIEPQKLYDTNAFINIIPAKWKGLNDSLCYDNSKSLGLPSMILSYGSSGYSDLSGNVSKSTYFTDMASFGGLFRYAKDFYYDKIIFETTDEFAYKNIGVNSGSTAIVINEDKLFVKKITTFEYLPFYLGSVANGENGSESAIGLINYSSMFDLSKYADFGSLNYGSYITSGLTYSTSQSDLLEQERRNKIRGILDGSTDLIDIDPLDYAYSLTGPFGLEGMQNAENLYPFGLIDVADFLSGTTTTYKPGWPYQAISTMEYAGTKEVDGITLNTTAIVGNKTDLTNNITYDGATFIIDTGTSVTLRTLDVTDGESYKDLNNWTTSTATYVKEYIFTPNQHKRPIIGDDSYLNFLNTSLRTSSNTPLYLSSTPDTTNILRSSFITTTLNADGNNTAGYLPRGLSNTIVKYQKKSHVWIYGTVINQFSNEMNMFATSFHEKNNGRIVPKSNTLSKTTKTKNIDNNALFDYALSKSTIIKPPIKYGTTTFYTSGTDLLMDYKVDRDQSDYPITGEFIGRLTVKDICGNLATTILKFFITNKEDRSGYVAIPSEDLGTVTSDSTPETPTVTTTTTTPTVTTTTTTTVTTPTVVSRTVTLECVSTTTYGIYVTAIGSKSGDLLSDYELYGGKTKDITVRDDENLTLAYTMISNATKVTSVKISNIPASWVTSGTFGSTTINAVKITNNFTVTFTVAKTRVKPTLADLV